MKVRFQGIELSERQVDVLRNIVREAVGEFGDHPDHGAMVELHRMPLPAPRPFDPRPELTIGGHCGPRPIGLRASTGEAQVSEEWRRWDLAQRG